ncbi:restriction endonuclease subunit S [Fusobacterium pseudoperiodonticum]|uniref:Restriction endonuclease subunit S n=1 Tax=Fusobacterium pseudoperiodonticum TaxID=2663009 RepID=A0A2D3PSN5_9FUSO|nr:restriction endonuclease subunit S [Fusobacterium pseudoperiodonticum]ATV70703.1 restriction endonuclease subunit S [Fusobacterium pseudoperiodonticum]
MKIFKLKDISKFIKNGVTIKQNISSKEGIPITRIETISKGIVDFNKLGYADIFELEKYRDWLLQKGDILISHINSEKHLGKSAIFLDNDINIIHGMNLLCIRAIDNIVFPEYLQLFFKTNQYKKQIKKIMKKSVNQASFSVNDFKEILITLPELDIQEKIIKKVKVLEFFLENCKLKLKLLSELNKSLFTTMFGDPFSKVINKEEEKSFLKDITIINPSKKEIEEIKSNLEISFITMADISEDGRINVDNIKKLEDVKNNFTFFKENDVLFAKITPCMENGKGGVAKSLKNNIGFGTTEIHVLRPISNITNSQWIYHLTKLPLFRKDAEIHMTGSAGQKRVPTTYLANFKIKVPPIELQNKFAERIEKIEKLKFIFGRPLISTTLKNSYKRVNA